MTASQAGVASAWCSNVFSAKMVQWLSLELIAYHELRQQSLYQQRCPHTWLLVADMCISICVCI